LNGSFRIPPFAAFIPGSPGIGKSEFCALLHMSIGNVNGYSVDDKSLYRIQAASNFHDSYFPGQWCLLCDDIDTNLAPPSANSVSHVMLVNQLLNSTPMNLEAASVDQKGKHYAAFTLAAYTTNYPDARLRGYGMPDMFWRRFNIHVDLKVKPEFANDDGSVNSTKANGVIDVWNVTVSDISISSYPNPMDKYGSAPIKNSVTFITVIDTFKYINQLYAEHRKNRKNFMQAKASLKSASHCGVCGMSCDSHSVVCLQGVPTSTGLGIYAILFNFMAFYNPMVAAFLAFSFVIYAFTWLVWSSSVLQYFLILQQAVRLLPVVDTRSVSTFVKSWWSLTMTSVGVSLHHARITCGDKYKQHGKVFLGAGVLLGVLIAALKMTEVGRGLLRRGLFQGDVDRAATSKLFFKGKENWKRVDQTYVAPYTLLKSPTYSIDDFISILQQRVVKIKGVCYDVKGIRLNKAFVLTMRHAVTDGAVERAAPVAIGKTISIFNKRTQSPISFVLSEERVQEVSGRDLVVLYVPEMFPLDDGWDLLSKMSPISQGQPGLAADDASLVFDEGVMKSSVRVTASRMYAGKVGGKSTWIGKFDTKQGDCGAPLLLFFGTTFTWAALHGCIDNYGVTMAEEVVRSEVEYAIDVLQARVPAVPDVVVDLSQLEKNGRPVDFQGLPAKSSLAVARTYSTIPLEVVGTLVNKVTEMTTKTSIRPSMYAADVVDLEVEVMGRSGCFAPPVFNGHMVVKDDVERWVDPFTLNLEATINKGGHPALWDLAVNDYVHGVEELVERDSVRVLTDYETVLGIDGTTLGGTNLHTSAGAPWFTTKESCVDIDHATRTVRFHPKLLEQIQRIECILKTSGYSPVSIFCLKDEALKVEKVLAGKIRVFNIMGFAFNFVLKKYFAPISEFMRRHRYFFENACGMNIASNEVDTLLLWLFEHPNFKVSDRAYYDVHMSTLEWLYMCKACDKIAELLRYTSEEKVILHNLLVSALYMTCVVKNDVFLQSNRMGTGAWFTLHANCIRQSLQDRYAFYKLACDGGYRPKCFRTYVRQINLGDDGLGSVSSLVSSWFNQVTMAEALKDIGAEVTSATKGKILEPFDDFEDCTFLKRHFRKVKGVWVAPLEKSTLCKMLLWRGRSKLSEVDHASQMLSNVLAESVLHGEEFFERVKKLVLALIIKYELVSRYLVIGSFDEYFEKYKNGSLSTWDPIENDFTL